MTAARGRSYGSRVSVDGQRADPVVAQQQREQLPDRPEPADQHVVVGHGHTGRAEVG